MLPHSREVGLGLIRMPYLTAGNRQQPLGLLVFCRHYNINRLKSFRAALT